METHIDPDIDDPVRIHYRAIVSEVTDSMERDRDLLILYMFYIQEREKPEICEILSLSSLHFSRVLFRARQRFKLKWETRIDSAKQDFIA